MQRQLIKFLLQLDKVRPIDILHNNLNIAKTNDVYTYIVIHKRCTRRSIPMRFWETSENMHDIHKRTRLHILLLE